VNIKNESLIEIKKLSLKI